MKYLSQQTPAASGPNEPSEDAGQDVIVLGGLGGRADQAFSLIHHLYMYASSPLQGLRKLYLVTDNGVLFVLSKGKHKIATPVAPNFFTHNVGIIPVGTPSVISTRGLEWDVQDWRTEFGGQLSTSNHIISDHVTVETSEAVLFTTEFDAGESGLTNPY